MTIAAHVVAMRPPRLGSPVQVATIREVSIAVIASAWGFWCGNDGENPAVAGARDALVASALAQETDWPAALVRAFAAASAAIDRLPAERVFEDFLPPETSLTCGVATPAGVHVAWIGGVVAGVLDHERVLHETAPHTMRRKMLAEGQSLLPFAEHPLALTLDTLVRVVGPSHLGGGPPELAAWPPLQPGQSLVLAPRPAFTAVRERLPRAREDVEPWLRAALAAGADNDRLAVMLER